MMQVRDGTEHGTCECKFEGMVAVKIKMIWKGGKREKQDDTYICR